MARKQSRIARRATSYDVARAAGVAQSTVSRCFDPDSPVSAETRERVRKAAARIGYVPNALARSLITRRSNMVGVVTTRLTNRNNPDVVFEIGDALEAVGQKMLLLVVENDDAAEPVVARAMGFPLDGLIACAQLGRAEIERFVARGAPLAFFNRDIRIPGVDCVRADHAGPAALAAERLFAAGHRRFLCVCGPPNSPVSEDRTRAFLGRLATLGVADAAVLSSDYSYEGGRARFLSHAAAHGAPDAVFCANDQMAFGVMDAARFELGLRVPQDMSIVGSDDVPDAARPIYDLTTVRQDLPAMARAVVRLVERRRIDPSVAGVVELAPARLIVRGSARLAAEPVSAPSPPSGRARNGAAPPARREPAAP